ncbi:hypothetical protein B0T20DRAFT_77556 [Sordaria brevicollis]|uniref:Uncharacterized protein n=1 Tax=Sordaria brevicollis TaxID=83679 RepID=A0AAE0P1K9_SORBR|nr:hypothetical protein B0T20DRAFT_77556 [Sordaria brevicollis]
MLGVSVVVECPKSSVGHRMAMWMAAYTSCLVGVLDLVPLRIEEAELACLDFSFPNLELILDGSMSVWMVPGSLLLCFAVLGAVLTQPPGIRLSATSPFPISSSGCWELGMECGLRW